MQLRNARGAAIVHEVSYLLPLSTDQLDAFGRTHFNSRCSFVVVIIIVIIPFCGTSIDIDINACHKTSGRAAVDSGHSTSSGNGNQFRGVMRLLPWDVPCRGLARPRTSARIHCMAHGRGHVRGECGCL